MSRRVRTFVALLFTAVALSTTACASVAGPHYNDCTGGNNSETCSSG